METVGGQVRLNQLGPGVPDPWSGADGLAEQGAAPEEIKMGGVVTGEEDGEHGAESGSMASDREAMADGQDTAGHVEQFLGDGHTAFADLLGMDGLEVGGVVAGA